MTPTASILAVSNAWPPMAAGTGHALRGMLGARRNTVVLVPRRAEPGATGEALVIPAFRFSGRVGGPLKLYSALQHLEIVGAPSWWCWRHRSARPGLVVCAQPLFAGVGGLLGKLLFGVPYVVLTHGEELTALRSDHAPLRLRLRCLRLVLRHAAAVICNAKNTRRLAERLYGVPAAKLHVIHPALDVRRYADPPAEEVARLRRQLVGIDGAMVLMVGRLVEPHKGFDIAIEALAEIVRAVPQAKLVIVGPGDPSALRALAGARGVLTNVEFLGPVSAERLWMLFTACDVFLLPGREVDGSAEGFGVVFLEAGLAGKPVVGGMAGGTPEAIVDGESGVLVDGRAPESVARAVTSLLRDRGLAARMGEQGRTRVLRDFDGRRQHECFARLVADLLQPVEER